MTLVDKLTAAIANQQAEVDRLAAQLAVDVPAARAKLQTLQTLLTKATPTVETLIANLHSVGIHVDDV